MMLGFYVFLPGVILSVCVALLGAVGYRSVRERGLRRQLANLPPSQQVAVLLPLRQDCSGDTRKIVSPLLRRFRLSTAPLPSDAPTGRGDEPSPSRPRSRPDPDSF
jgi:hypothetical protein